MSITALLPHEKLIPGCSAGSKKHLGSCVECLCLVSAEPCSSVSATCVAQARVWCQATEPAVPLLRLQAVPELGTRAAVCRLQGKNELPCSVCPACPHPSVSHTFSPGLRRTLWRAWEPLFQSVMKRMRT